MLLSGLHSVDLADYSIGLAAELDLTPLKRWLNLLGWCRACSEPMCLDEVSLPLICGGEALPAVLLETLGRCAILRPMAGALAVLTWLSGRRFRRSTFRVWRTLVVDAAVG